LFRTYTPAALAITAQRATPHDRSLVECTHIGMARRQPHPNAGRERDHGRRSFVTSTAADAVAALGLGAATQAATISAEIVEHLPGAAQPC